MSTDIDDLIREFSAAHRAAEQNAKLMCCYPSAKVVDECSARMERVADTDEAIYALAASEAMPQPLVDFLKAESDKGCVHCWVSSSRGKNHPDCNYKIDRWFVARAALISYGESLTDTTLDAVSELVRLRSENERLRMVIATAADELIGVQNYCHGIKGAGGAKREAKDVESRLRKAIAEGSPVATTVAKEPQDAE